MASGHAARILSRFSRKATLTLPDAALSLAAEPRGRVLGVPAAAKK
jgi:hypothetical protein